jgi:RNA polymerase sigma-70 factor (ECF subfamily)
MKNYSNFSDEDLTALLKARDAEAFSELFKRYNKLLFVHAFRLSGDEEEARDIVQDVFAILWDRRAEINFTSNFSGFLYTMTRHRVFDGIAHKKVAEKYRHSIKDFFEKGEAKTDHLLRTRELEAIIEKEIAMLPAHLRETFELRRKGLSHKEIAEQLDISEKTARNQASKAMKELRTKLGILVYLFLLLNS